jgi:CxxC motif-containing protein (DUF1111 family)
MAFRISRHRLRPTCAVGLAGLVPLLAGALAGLAAPQSPGLEPGEERPGGAATTSKGLRTHDAFSQFSTGIGFEGESKFRIGNSIFRRLWVTAPSSTDSSDGLGPLYNARGCQNCHLKDGRGHPPAANWPEDDAVSMLLRLSIPPETDEQRQALGERRASVIPEPTYGGQLQDLAVPGLDAEGHMRIDYTDVPMRLAGGSVASLRKPAYSITDLKFGPLHPKTMISPRVAPQMIGLGLLEAIPEASIRAAADADDANRDGISGRANEVWSKVHSRVMLGRFGWKAGMATVADQSGEAFAADVGISNPVVPRASGDCTPAQPSCLAAPDGNSARNQGHEIGRELFDLVVFYSQNLAVPARRNWERQDVRRGKAIFSRLGCAVCHTPSHVTGVAEGQPHLSNQTIWPYTDLLLHDMGEGLADNRPEGVADGREWRTPPLWGIGLTRLVSQHTFFLHDGRARSLEEAVLWHGGEALAARDGYAKLTKRDREALLAFLSSL